MQNKHSKENPTIQAEKSKHKPTEQTADMPVEKTSRIPTEETSHMPAEKTSHVPAVKNSSILTEQASVMQPKENSENKTNNAASPVPEIPVMIQQASIYQTFSRESLSEHFQQFPEKPIEIHGTVHRIREMNGFSFLILRTGRELIQCVVDNGISSQERVIEGSSIRVTGYVNIDEKSHSGPEIRVSSLVVLSSPAKDLPFVLGKKKLDVSLDTNLDNRSVALRHPEERAVFRIQEGITQSFREYFTQQSFVEIHTPKIVFSGAEGGANIFKLNYFGKEVYLAQSPQFYKQAMVGVFERVFEVGAVYRAEKHNTSRHLNEYIGLDVEMGFIDSYEDLLKYETGWLSHMVQHLSDHYKKELELLKATVPVLSGGIPSISFHEAKQIAKKKLKHSVAEDRDDLSPDEETVICKEIFNLTGSEFVFVTHYPTSKRPFYAMEDPKNTEVTLSFDLLFRGLEVTTGGQRIHDYQEQVKKMVHRGMDPAVFESYLQIHQAGMPPHGGFGAGLERLTMKMLNLPNIRQASLYPRDMNRVIP